MPSDKTYNLFISHVWDSDVDYCRLVELLSRESSLDWCDRSVPRSAPVLAPDLIGIREALAHRIYQSDVVLVMSAGHLDKSKWVRYELDVARELNKPIVGIAPRRAVTGASEVKDTATTIVEWTSDSIAQTIKAVAA